MDLKKIRIVSPVTFSYFFNHSSNMSEKSVGPSDSKAVGELRPDMAVAEKNKLNFCFRAFLFPPKVVRFPCLNLPLLFL